MKKNTMDTTPNFPTQSKPLGLPITEKQPNLSEVKIHTLLRRLLLYHRSDFYHIPTKGSTYQMTKAQKLPIQTQ
ncbi:hypothetical protein AQUCO_03200040v1 [Aquilegia coerulea]|uniref:Uncharacterized protein n=1 Tax=Aquilegia coerulea TaxID=218851 RepID=A0A2G5CZU4_AQUCA|nr:hypothetical protein AQUCO_03200040v1 [Aquilegia coerulea]